MLLMCPLRLVSKLQRTVSLCNVLSSSVYVYSSVSPYSSVSLHSSVSLFSSVAVSAVVVALLSLSVFCLCKSFGLFIDFVTVVASSRAGLVDCASCHICLPQPFCLLPLFRPSTIQFNQPKLFSRASPVACT